jgi:hypothetical protein
VPEYITVNNHLVTQPIEIPVSESQSHQSMENDLTLRQLNELEKNRRLTDIVDYGIWSCRILY